MKRLFLLLSLVGCSGASAGTLGVEIDTSSPIEGAFELELELTRNGVTTEVRETLTADDLPFCASEEGRRGDTVVARVRVRQEGTLLGETAVETSMPTEGLLRLTVDPGCDLSSCAIDRVCGVGGCTEARIRGAMAGARCGGARDAGAPDASTDACLPSAETCNGMDDDCNGEADDGEAGASCEGGLNASGACVAGACDLQCEEGFADCDGEPGCEVPTAEDPANCGGCGVSCEGTQRCVEGGCVGPVLQWASATPDDSSMEARASGDGATIWLTYRGGDFGALSFPEPESNGLLLGEFGEDGVPQWALVGDSPEIEFSTEVVSGPSFRCFLASTGRPLIFDGDTYNEDHEDFWGCTNADGVLAWADTLDSNIVTLVANDDAIFAIASNRDGSPVDLGEGPTNANAIARIDPATGSVEWQVGFLESVARPSSLSRYDATSDRMCFVISSFDAGDVRYEGETYVFDDGDALIACRDANTGAHLWARHITGERTQRVDVMAIAPDGGVFVAGDYSEELLVDDAAISCGEEFCFGEPYMLRLDPTGRLDWARELTSDEVFSQPGVDSMTSSSRAVYTMSRGVFDGPEGFIPMSTPLLSAHDPVTGDQLWSVLVESPGSILFQSFDIDVDDDHLVLYGRLSGDVTVAGEPALSVDGEGGILSFAVDD